MNRFFSTVLKIFTALLLILGIGPYLIPVRPAPGTKRPEEAAEEGSHFIEVNGIKIHYYRAGQGAKTLFLMHGLVASAYTWHKVMEPLAALGYTVIAFDRPAHGLTERPLHWTGDNPYSMKSEIDLTIGLMDALGIEKAVLVGHSAGGRVAAETARCRPERVKALIFVAPAIGIRTVPRWLLALLKTPQAHRIGPLITRRVMERRGVVFAARAWHDPSQISETMWQNYRKPYEMENWDQALFEYAAERRPQNYNENLDDLEEPVMIITGDDDRIVPTANSLRLAQGTPRALLAVIPDCGHIPQEEKPKTFTGAVEMFLESLEESRPDLTGPTPTYP